MRKLYLLFTFISIYSTIVASTDCSNGRYQEKVFDDYIVDANNIYARKQKSNGVWQDLKYDVYLPKNDTETKRPVVFLAHGGGYIDLIDQRSPDIVRMAQELALRGYVVFSVDYREEPSVASLLSEEKMVKALGRALIDIRDATCYLIDTTINYNNPYGVDIEQVIIGGVSAGSVSFLHGVFLDSLSWVSPQYQEWLLEIEPNTQALLDNKYCGASVIGVINVSGAIQDTSWIKVENASAYPPMLHIHGTADVIVPYNIDRPFGLSSLPNLMGSFPIHNRLERLGVRSELDTWNGLGHVPFFGIDFQALFGNNPLDFLFTPTVWDPSMEHIVNFCYSLLNCDELLTLQNNSKIDAIGFYPNPTSGNFKIQFPELHQNAFGTIQIINNLGQKMYSNSVIPGTTSLQINEEWPNGYYTINISYEDVQKNYYGQLIVLK